MAFQLRREHPVVFKCGSGTAGFEISKTKHLETCVAIWQSNFMSVVPNNETLGILFCVSLFLGTYFNCILKIIGPQGWGCSSLVKHLPHLCKALGSISSIAEK